MDLLHGLLILSFICLLTTFLALLYRCYCLKISRDGLLLDSFFSNIGGTNFIFICSAVIGRNALTSCILSAQPIYQEFGLRGQSLFAAASASPFFIITIFAVKLRIHYNDSKTFLQVINAKFGRGCHLFMICFSICVNLVTTALICSEAVSIINSLIPDVSPAVIYLIMVLMCCVYLIIGGEGGYFWSSYTMLILILAIFASFNFSYLSKSIPLIELYKSNFRFSDYFLQMLMIFLGTSGSVIADQSIWTIATSANPNHLTGGFLASGCILFFLPFSFSFIFGKILNEGEGMKFGDKLHINELFPLKNFSYIGEYLFLIAIVSLMILSLSAQILSLANISVYDIYLVYIKNKISIKHKLLRGNELRSDQSADILDGKNNLDITINYFTKEAQDFKIARGIIIISSVFILITGLVSISTDLKFNLIFNLTLLMTSSFIFPIMLSIAWCGCRSGALVISGIVGLVTNCFIFSVFLILSGEDIMKPSYDFNFKIMLVISTLVGSFIGGALCIVLSFCLKQYSNNSISENARSNISSKTIFTELKLAADPLQFIYKKAETAALAIGIGMPIILCIIVYLVLLISNNWTENNIHVWIKSSFICVTICCCFLIISPLLQFFNLCFIFKSGPKHIFRPSTLVNDNIFTITDGILEKINADLENNPNEKNFSYEKIYPDITSLRRATNNLDA